MSGFRPKWRWNGRRKGKGKGRFRSKGRGRGYSKGRGRGRKGKGRDDDKRFSTDILYGGKKGNGKTKNKTDNNGCSVCGSKWHRDQDCPVGLRDRKGDSGGKTGAGLTHTWHHNFGGHHQDQYHDDLPDIALAVGHSTETTK
eukprot:6954505-Pyramimonas_sp.AAC.1